MVTPAEEPLDSADQATYNPYTKKAISFNESETPHDP